MLKTSADNGVVGQAETARLYQIVDTFEEVWQAGKQPEIDRYLPADESLRPMVLIKLVHIDLENRLRAGEKVRVETYLDRYPQIVSDTAAVIELVTWEFALRRRGEIDLTSEEYLQRFPHFAGELRKRLSFEPETLPSVANLPPTQQTGDANRANKPDAPPTIDFEDGRGLTDFLAPPQKPDEIGRLGTYRILKILGTGGMGVVYKAEDPGLERLVALKAMLPSLAASDSAKKRFLREAKAAAAVKHSHIVTIFQVSEDRGVPFLAMEFLEGEPLDNRLKRETILPMAEVMRIGREMAEGMAAAHERGLIHRDIKPANTWLEGKQGHVKILDFGLARSTDDQSQLTQRGAIIGTPAYMAPEQCCGDELDVRCDLWSLGVVLYHMCTGAGPFKGANALATLRAVEMNDPPPPTQVNAEVPAGLSDLVMKLLEKDRARRPGSAQEVVEALRQLERLPEPRRSAQTGVSDQGPKSGPVPARNRRKPLLLMIAGTLIVAAVVAAIVLFWQTPQGTVRIESDDPNVVIVFDQSGPTIKGADKTPITLRTGEHGLIVKRGDFSFETDKIFIKKGETITLKIELLRGKVQVAADGKVIGEGTLPPGKSATTDPVPKGNNGSNKMPPDGPSIMQSKGPTTTKDNLLVNGDFETGDFSGWTVKGAAKSGVAKRGTPIPTTILSDNVVNVRSGHFAAWAAVADHNGIAFDISQDVPVHPGSTYDVGFWACLGTQDDRRLGRRARITINKAVVFDAEFIGANGLTRDDFTKVNAQWTAGPADSRANVSFHLTGSGTGLAGFSYDDFYLVNANPQSAGIPPSKIGVAPPRAEDPTSSMVRKFQGHSGQVLGVALSGDGKRVLTGSADKTAILWDAASGSKLQTFQGHADNIQSVALSGDGKHVLTGSTDKTAILWDAASGSKLQTFQGHTLGVKTVALTGDGKLVLTGSWDGTAILWEAASGKRLQTFQGHTDTVTGVALSDDGKFVLTGSFGEDRAAILWEADSGKKIQIFQGHSGYITSVALTGDGKHVLTGSVDKTAILWDAASGTIRQTFQGHTSVVEAVALSGDGKHVLTGSADKTAILWDAASGKKIRTFQGHNDYVESVALSSDGKLVLTGSVDKTAILWEVKASPTTFTNLVQKFQGHTDSVNGVALSDDGKHVLTGSTDKTAILWDAASGKKIQTFQGHTGEVTGVALSGNGKHVLTGSLDGTAMLWEAVSGKKIQTFQGQPHEGQPRQMWSVALSDNSKLVLTGSWPCDAILWDAATGRKIRSFQGHAQQVMSVTFSRDGKQVLTGSYDGTAILWEADTGKKLQTFQGHNQAVFSVAISPDGKQVLTGADDKSAILWEANTGKKLQAFQHEARVNGVALSGDGKHVLTGSADKTAILWEADTGKKIQTFQHEGRVNSVALSSDGKRILTGSYDGTAILWEVNAYNDRKVAEWVLSLGGAVCIDHELKYPIRKVEELPPGSWRVRRIDFWHDDQSQNDQLTDAGLKELAGLKDLQMLNLRRCTQITDAGLKNLAGLNSLNMLVLDNTKVSSLKGLAGLESLQTLHLFNTQVTDTGLKELVELKNLQQLQLAATQVTDAGLKELAGLKSLQWLGLSHNKIRDAGLKELAGLKGLQMLFLNSTQVSDAGLKELAKLKGLINLDLSDTMVTKTGRAELRKMLPDCAIN